MLQEREFARTKDRFWPDGCRSHAEHSCPIRAASVKRDLHKQVSLHLFIGHFTSVSFLVNSLILKVARGGIEPPTRGFSVLPLNRAKLLTRLLKMMRPCPIFPRDNGT